MTTAIDAATAIGRANTDLLIQVSTAVQDANQRWFELSARILSETTRSPAIDKAYWDEVSNLVSDLRASSLGAIQKAVTDWQGAWTEAVRDVQPPFQDPAFIGLFQAWLPEPAAEEAKAAPKKSGAPNG